MVNLPMERNLHSLNIMKRLFESLLDARARQTIKQRDL